jgi:peptidoglycan pentaglycine glycine transferase (the first glycine)
MNSLNEWNSLIANLPGAHILQTWQWGQVKARFGWTPNYYCWYQAEGGYKRIELIDLTSMSGEQPVASALVLTRSARLAGYPIRVMYIPKGPLLDWENRSLRHSILLDIVLLARQKKAIFIKIDPDVPQGEGYPGMPDATLDQTGQAVITDLDKMGWRYSDEQIQFKNTVVLNLNQSLDHLLANMKQKTRYNLRLAERRGVQIRPGMKRDFPLLYRMYAETSLRDGFVIRNQDYYQALWGEFFDSGMAEILIAEVEEQPVAGLFLFMTAGKAWYLYGMSRQVHREKMPNYLLQWEAIRRAKANGCTVYDLWGAPDELREEDPLWGVFRFKEGLGGHVVRYLGAWDFPVKPVFYQLYVQILPQVLEIMRRQGKKQTRQ